MARQTFFSFRYKKDNWRASIVRNGYVTQDRKSSGYFDSADWATEVKQHQANTASAAPNAAAAADSSGAAPPPPADTASNPEKPPPIH